MKPMTILAASLASALLSACVAESEPVQTDNGGKEYNTFLTAEAPSNDTKTAFSDAGAFSWTSGDAISVHTSTGAFKEFELYSGEGNKSGVFAGILSTGETATGVAVYPHSTSHSLSGNALTVHLASEFVWSSDGNSHAPMIASISGNSLSFKHIGGLLKVTFSNVPSTARKFVFTAEGQKVTGDFVISDYTVDGASISTADSITEDTVTITFDSPSTEMSFYVPLPVGIYNGFKAELINSTGDVVVLKTRYTDLSVTRGKLILMSAIAGAASNGKMMLFDFGNTSSTTTSHTTTSPDMNGNYWNNITIATTTTASGNGNSYSLLYKDNTATGYTLTLTSNVRSNGSGNGGLTYARWSSTTATSLGELAVYEDIGGTTVATATEDYFFAQGTSTVCSFSLSGLNPAKAYKFFIFGSRTGMSDTDQREAKYSISGANEFEGKLLISGLGKVQNTDNLLESDLMYPKADGTLNFSFQKESSSTSNNYYQLNCMKVMEYEGGEVPAPVYSYSALEVTSSEETFSMHKANDATVNVFEGVSTFTNGEEVAMTATTTTGKDIALTTTATVTGVAYFVADLDNFTYTFQKIDEIIAEGSAVNGWSNSNGVSLSYDGAGVFSGTNLVFTGTSTTSAKAVSDASRFNFVIKGSWNPTFQRVEGSRTDIEASSYGSSSAIPINPGTYDITLNLRDFTFTKAASAVDGNRITVMGSSVPRGYTATDYYGYPFLYEDVLEARSSAGTSSNPWYISNISVAGNSTTNLLNRYDELVTDGGKYVIFALSLGNEGIHEASDKAATYNQWKTNMQTLISQARADGKTVVVTGNYARDDFNSSDYDYVKAMNLEIHGWDVPSVNLLGAIDSGTGTWATGYSAGDTYHPNNAGHVEMSYTLVPSLFDALEAGKTLPSTRTTTGSYSLSDKDVLKFKPEATIHPFTVSFGIKTTDTGRILNFFSGDNERYVEIDADGHLCYQGITGSTVVNDGAWHQVTLTHYYARGTTMLYADAVLQGAESEKVTAGSMFVGYNTKVSSATFRELMFWRSGMNAEEIAALVTDGRLLNSSLEIYAPLASGLTNLAMSTNTLSVVGSTAVVPDADDGTPKFNGKPMTVSGESTYVQIEPLTQGQTIALRNIDPDDYWWDVDYFSVIGGVVTFLPVSGYYNVTIHTGTDKYVEAYPVTSEGARPTLAEGGLYMLGWGVGKYNINKSMLGWTLANKYAMAEISDGVYQFSGYAGTQSAGGMGVRYRSDGGEGDFSPRCYFQFDNWGNSWSALNYSARALDYLEQSDTNLHRKETTSLTAGEFYVLKIDFTSCTIDGGSITSGTPSVDFYKVD